MLSVHSCPEDNGQGQAPGDSVELGLGLFHSLAEASNLIRRPSPLGWEVSYSLILAMVRQKC